MENDEIIFGNEINPQERRMELASGQPGLMIYYEASRRIAKAFEWICYITVRSKILSFDRYVPG